MKSVVLDVMQLGEPDASGRRRPEATGETVTLECDQVIVAVGVSPNPSCSSEHRRIGTRQKEHYCRKRADAELY